MAQARDRLLRRDEAAEQLGVSVDTVKRLNKSGALPVVQVGPRAVRIDPDELTDYIERNTRGLGYRWPT